MKMKKNKTVRAGSIIPIICGLLLVSLAWIASGQSQEGSPLLIPLKDIPDIHIYATIQRPRSRVVKLALTADGRLLALGKLGREGICLWDLESGQFRDLASPDSSCFCLDDRILTSLWDFDRLILFDVSSGSTRAFDHAKGIFRIALSPDGGTIATRDKRQVIDLWDARRQRL
jgi:WD40 repeat protein